MKRLLFAAGLGLCLLTGTAGAAKVPVEVVLNGAPLAAAVTAEAGVTYVPLRAFCTQAGMEVTWDGAAGVASGGGNVVRAQPGASYIEANGRYFYTGAASPVTAEDGRILVPVRALARACGGSAAWAEGRVVASAGTTAVEPGESYYDPDAVEWLARIISAESQGEPLAGQIAVGNVVLNRVKSGEFPDTIYGVIFDRQDGVQFTPVSAGSIYWMPTAESVIAAKLCLEGASTAGDCLYFLNPEKSASGWIAANRTYAMTLGSHDFYR